MKRYLLFLSLSLFVFSLSVFSSVQEGDTIDLSDELLIAGQIQEAELLQDDSIYQKLKIKFIEGNPYFMGVISLTFVLGLAFSIERIIYLNLADINSKKFVKKIEEALEKGDVEGAKEITRNTRGPVASIYYQGLMRIDQDIDIIEKSVISYGTVQTGLLERNFSWITLFIAMAPSLGFLGTVLGMLKTFDDIEAASAISPTIVAGGMKVVLITTIAGLIVALVLQVFYNYILSKDESIVQKMEDSSITLLDMILKYKENYGAKQA